MRLFYAIGFVLALSLPAGAADDQNIKQEVENLASHYQANFNKKDSAGVAALYANGGILVNSRGIQPDIKKFYDNAFAGGFDHIDIRVDQVLPLGTDTALSIGEFTTTGKNHSGTAMQIDGRWTAVEVRENGTWKHRMLTAFDKAKPPPVAK